MLPLLFWEVFEPSVDIAISCSVDKLFEDVFVIFREPDKLFVDVILLEFDVTFADLAIPCSVDKLFGDVAVILRETGELSGDVTLLEVDEFSVNTVVKFCDKEEL